MRFQIYLTYLLCDAGAPKRIEPWGSIFGRQINQMGCLHQVDIKRCSLTSHDIQRVLLLPFHESGAVLQSKVGLVTLTINNVDKSSGEVSLMDTIEKVS